MAIVAKRAQLVTPIGLRFGVALRDHRDIVHFIDDATGLWEPLGNDRIADLTLAGDVGLIEAARLSDGPGYTWVMNRNVEHARRVAA